MCGKLCLHRLKRLHLQPVRHPGYFPEDVPGPTVTQRPADSTGDVFQLPILVLQEGQPSPDSLEGGFRKLEVGHVKILLGLLSTGTGLVAGLRSGCSPGFRNGRGWGGSGTKGSSDDSSVPASVISMSGPSLYTTLSSAMVNASSSAALMHPYC